MGLFGKKNKDEQGAPLKSPSPAKAFFKNLMGGSPSKVERDFVPPVHRKRSPRREVLPAPAVLPASPPPTNLKLKEDTVMEVKIMVDTTWPAVDTSRLARALAQVPGVRGGRLLAAAQRDAALADNLTTLAEEVAGLGREAEATYGHRQNVATLEACFTEVLVMMDLNGPRLDHTSIGAVRRLASLVREAGELVGVCRQPGWLARMARVEGVHDQFARLHNAALSVMESQHMAAAPLPSARRLPAAAYADLSKAMRKLLKQLGGGSVEAGILRVRADEGVRRHVAQAAAAPAEAVLADAQLDPDVTSAAAVLVDGPARDGECAKVFREYVTSAEGHLTADGFQLLCADMGLLEGVDEYDRPAAARAALVAADSDYDGALSFAEFRAFYARHPTTAARLQLRLATSLHVERQLHDTFHRFAAFGAHKRGAAHGSPTLSPDPASDPGLDGARFSKLCKDCGLLGGGLAPQYVDLVFSKAKPRDARRMSFDNFLAALALVADHKGQSLARVAVAVVAAAGPALRATKSSYVKLHDDKSMFTGIYARGGPSTDSSNLDLSAMVNRARDTGRPAPPSGLLPAKLDLTKAESPVLSTQYRVARPAPLTPGRGASMAATAARAAARAAAGDPGDPAPPPVFGRTSTPRASLSLVGAAPGPARGRTPRASPKPSPRPTAAAASPTKSAASSPTKRAAFAKPTMANSKPALAVAPELAAEAAAQASPAADEVPAQPTPCDADIDRLPHEFVQRLDLATTEVAPSGRAKLLRVFTAFAGDNPDTEEGPVLNDDAFLRLARAARLSELGGGLSDGQLGAIFQTTANAFTGCISASQFRVSLGLVAAAAGVEAEEALARAADAPLPAAPPAAARRTGSQASPSTLERSGSPAMESAMAAVAEEAALTEEAAVAEEAPIAEEVAVAKEAALTEEAAVAEEAPIAEEVAVPAALESVDAVDVELAAEAQPAEAPHPDE